MYLKNIDIFIDIYMCACISVYYVYVIIYIHICENKEIKFESEQERE